MAENEKNNKKNMVDKDQYDEILSRIQHIKSLFAFGEGILPFLEELFVFLREVTPLLNEVSDSIMNTTGMMPDAATEIDSAVEETSDATYRIMESVESIIEELDDLEQRTKEIESYEDDIEGAIDEVRTNADSIMNALQFHDIVSQKMVHVRSVLSEVQQKMLELFTRVYELEIDEDVRNNIMETLGVDVDEFDRILQSKIEVKENLTADEDPREQEEGGQFSQDDIDDLFG